VEDKRGKTSFHFRKEQEHVEFSPIRQQNEVEIRKDSGVS